MPSDSTAPGVAVLGCGAWGRNHVRTLKTLGALAAVADAVAATAEAAAAAADVPARDFDALLKDPAITAVVIAAPDALHAALARRVLDAGKHALVEKPMTMTVEDARDLERRAQAGGLVLMTGHILRYHAGFRRLQELAGNGTLGTLRHIAARRLHFAPGAARHALWDLAPHDLSMILALAGRLPSGVRATVTAPDGAPGSDAGALPQAGAVMLDFDGGLSAEISFSAISPVKLHQLTVTGSAAQAVFEDSKPWPEKLTLFRPGLETLRRPVTREAVELVPGEPLAEELRAFLMAIKGGPAPESAAPEALRVVRVLAAAARALDSGRAETP